MNTAVELAHGALHLGVALVADHDELIALFVQLGQLHMHLAHQGAGGVKNPESALYRFVLDRPAHPVGAEYQRGSGRHIGQLFDEDRALFFQVVHHVGVVHNLVPHINWPAKFGERMLHDVNRTVHPGAKATRLGQQHFRCHHSTPISSTSKVTG